VCLFIRFIFAILNFLAVLTAIKGSIHIVKLITLAIFGLGGLVLYQAVASGLYFFFYISSLNFCKYCPECIFLILDLLVGCGFEAIFFYVSSSPKRFQAKFNVCSFML
jgi:hypothetical protein